MAPEGRAGAASRVAYPGDVRFRLSEWDVPMPDALVAYWTAWNEPDLEQIPSHLVVAVTDDVEWNDPRDSFVGIDELEQAIRRLRTSKPEYAFVIASEIDCHHDRLRYRWDMVRNGRILMEGLDVVDLIGIRRRACIARVDGFFGHPTPIDDGESGVPHRTSTLSRHCLDRARSATALRSASTGSRRAARSPGRGRPADR